MPAWTSPSTSERAAAPAGTASAAPPIRARAKARHPRRSRLGPALFALCAAPLALHVWRHHVGTLGADPLAALVHASGWWALALLLATLTVTPLRRLSVWAARGAEVRYGRRLSDWNFLIRHRRQLGLWSFFYAALHLTLHAVLGAGSLEELIRDAAERRFILLGLVAFALLVPLAATSTQAAMRKLKRRWAQLHGLVYPAAALAVSHAWWQTKIGHELPWGFAATALALLGARLLAWWAGDRARSGEVPERAPQPRR